MLKNVILELYFDLNEKENKCIQQKSLKVEHQTRMKLLLNTKIPMALLTSYVQRAHQLKLQLQ